MYSDDASSKRGCLPHAQPAYIPMTHCLFSYKPSWIHIVAEIEIANYCCLAINELYFFMMLLNASSGSPQDGYESVFHPSTFNLLFVYSISTVLVQELAVVQPSLQGPRSRKLRRKPMTLDTGFSILSEMLEG